MLAHLCVSCGGRGVNVCVFSKCLNVFLHVFSHIVLN